MKHNKNTFIPALGFVGSMRLREAENSEDMIALKALLEGALRRMFALDEQEDVWSWVQALFDDYLIIQREGKLLRYPYTLNDTDVHFGEPQEVVTNFEPLEENNGIKPDATFTEALKQGRGAKAFEVCIVRSGLSLNGNYYSDAVLREAAYLAEGVRVFVKSDDDHLSGRGTDVRNLIGCMSDVYFKEGSQTDQGAIYGTFKLMEPEGSVAVKLREAWDNNMADLFGFSIDASGSAKLGKRDGRSVRIASSISSIDSVDLIVRPGAGGGIVRFKESENIKNEGDNVWREKLITAIKAVAPQLLEDIDVETLTDEELDELYAKAFGANAQKSQEEDSTAASNMEEAFTEAVRMVETKINMRNAIERSSLPEQAKARLRERFNKEKRFSESEVNKAIRDEGDYLSSFGGGHVNGLGHIEITRTAGENTDRMLDAFFNPKHKDNREFRSFRECYIRMTGDTRVTGYKRNCKSECFREALDSKSFDQVLGDAIHRRLLAEYKTQSQYDIWKNLANIVPVNDFREQSRVRFGGYGDLPKVQEKESYLPLSSPTDEAAKYMAEKRGGTESITLEMIKNDDVGSIQRIPNSLTVAAKRTLSKFVLDFINKNPVIYDGKTLFHSDRNNLGTTALSDASYAAARLAMLKQKEPGSNAQLGIPPRNLWIPADLEGKAYDMFRRDTNIDESFVQSQHPRVIAVWYWEDAANWVLSTDLADLACVEVGFLDGQEEPELFVQDNPTVGSLFNNDTITYKIRHIYGGGVIDFRGLYKAVVA